MKHLTPILLLCCLSLLINGCTQDSPEDQALQGEQILSIRTDFKVSSKIPEGMVEVPAGEFIMGANNRDPDEKPVHQVYLDAFVVDRTEVTVSAYKACVNAGKCPKADTDKRCNAGVLGRRNHPINCVDWNQSVSFCKWKGKRLPTEAEWEKAARGSTGQKYPWGSEELSSTSGRLANVADENLKTLFPSWIIVDGYRDGYADTAPVRGYPLGSTPYGVQEMGGNVREWTSDWHDSSYYSWSPSRNPSGPSKGFDRVVRGGSWSLFGDRLRASNRYYFFPSYQRGNLGFRCAKSF